MKKLDNAAIGARIKKRSRALGLSQEKLAEMIFVSPHYIYEIERGLKTMSLETLANITDTLEVSADMILFGNSDEYVQNNLSTRMSRLFDNCSDRELELMLSVAESAQNASRNQFEK